MAYLNVYVLDDNGEATGAVYYFCTESCRFAFLEAAHPWNVPHVLGEDAEVIGQSVCDECCNALD